MNKITTPTFQAPLLNLCLFFKLILINLYCMYYFNSLTEKLDFNSKVVFLAGLIFACFC